jgi:hypothetical protein
VERNRRSGHQRCKSFTRRSQRCKVSMALSDTFMTDPASLQLEADTRSCRSRSWACSLLLCRLLADNGNALTSLDQFLQSPILFALDASSCSAMAAYAALARKLVNSDIQSFALRRASLPCLLTGSALLLWVEFCPRYELGSRGRCKHFFWCKHSCS